MSLSIDAILKIEKDISKYQNDLITYKDTWSETTLFMTRELITMGRHKLKNDIIKKGEEMVKHMKQQDENKRREFDLVANNLDKANTEYEDAIEVGESSLEELAELQNYIKLANDELRRTMKKYH